MTFGSHWNDARLAFTKCADGQYIFGGEHRTELRKQIAPLNDELDYDNFKSKVTRHQGSEGAAYEQSLHEVWSAMHKLQH